MSAINLGEVVYVTSRRQGEARSLRLIDALSRVVAVDVPDWPVVLSAARLKARRSLSYADAFAVVTAQRHATPVMTGDPEIVALADEVQVVDLRA